MDYQIKVISPSNMQYLHQCLEIAEENLEENGGTLMFPSIICHCQYIICAVKEDNVIGYIGLVKNFAIKNDLYVMQIAVRKNEMGKGVGTSLMKYLLQHSKGNKYITSNVKANNTRSNKLHSKMGFERFDSYSGYLYLKETDKIANNEYLFYTEEEKENE